MASSDASNRKLILRKSLANQEYYQSNFRTNRIKMYLKYWNLKNPRTTQEPLNLKAFGNVFKKWMVPNMWNMKKAYIITYHELNLNYKNRGPYYMNLGHIVQRAYVPCQRKDICYVGFKFNYVFLNKFGC